jgi:hypothetical protein
MTDPQTHFDAVDAEIDGASGGQLATYLEMLMVVINTREQLVRGIAASIPEPQRRLVAAKLAAVDFARSSLDGGGSRDLERLRFTGYRCPACRSQ